MARTFHNISLKEKYRVGLINWSNSLETPMLQ